MEFWPPSNNEKWTAEKLISLRCGFPFLKIFKFRDINGELNGGMFRMIRLLSNYLETNCETFVGISPVGSEILGHSYPGSDIDCMILYDSSLYGTELYSDYHAERQICHYAADFIRNIRNKGGPNIDFYYRDIDPVFVCDGLDHSSDARVAEAVANVCNIVTGQKIGQYRGNLSVLLKTVSRKRFENIITLTAEIIVNLEKSSLNKLWGKLELPTEMLQEAIIARKFLWKSRVVTLLNLA